MYRLFSQLFRSSVIVIGMVGLISLLSLRPALAQNSWRDVPRTHWAYPTLSRMIDAKLIEQPTSCGYFRRKTLTWTRYEFAIFTLRAHNALRTNRELSRKQIQCLPLLRRMTEEFAPEMEQLQPPKQRGKNRPENFAV